MADDAVRLIYSMSVSVRSNRTFGSRVIDERYGRARR
jgi:hypothetical protein